MPRVINASHELPGGASRFLNEYRYETMRAIMLRTAFWRIAATVLVAAMPLGCCTSKRACKRCDDIPAGAMPQPVGQYSCEWQVAQREAADPGQNMIYEHEWHRGGTELGPFGQRHIEKLAAQMSQSADQVLIESHFDNQANRVDEQLNDERRSAVVAALADRGVADAEERVALARARTGGLYGQEAVSIGTRRLNGGNRGQGLGGNSFGTGSGLNGGGAGAGGAGMGALLGGGGFF